MSAKFVGFVPMLVAFVGGSCSVVSDRRLQLAAGWFDGANDAGFGGEDIWRATNCFPSRWVEHGSKVRELPKAETSLKNVQFEREGRSTTFRLSCTEIRRAGCLILKNVKCVEGGLTTWDWAGDIWPSYSMAKPLLNIDWSSAAGWDRLRAWTIR